MANTFELISSVTVGSGGASTIDFNSIPSTYTDLVLEISARGSDSSLSSNLRYTFNGATTNRSGKYLTGSGTSTESGTITFMYAGEVNAASSTSGTFSNVQIYITNYASSNYKSSSVDGVQESNGTTSYATLAANLWSNTAAINAISLSLNLGSFVSDSTAYLYGVKNA